MRRFRERLGARRSGNGLRRDATATSHSSIRGADCDDFHFADGVIHPPHNGMEAENGDLPVSAVCSTGREISFFCDVSSEGFEP